MLKDGRILIADDNHASRMMLSLSLNELGLAERLTSFSNGKEVVDFIEELL